MPMSMEKKSDEEAKKSKEKDWRKGVLGRLKENYVGVEIKVESKLGNRAKKKVRSGLDSPMQDI
jgi:hypothetical protein